MITRVIVSAIVLVITNLIVGSISLSLGLLVAVTVSAVAVIGLILLALLGFCVLLEKLGLVAPGWTDSRLERLKSWATAKWRELPGWYESEKHRIIEMMVQRLKGKEAEAQNPGAAWKSIAMGLGFLLGVLLVRQTLHLSMAWSIALVALASVLFSVVVLAVGYRVTQREDSDQKSVQIVSSPVEAYPAVPSPELMELWARFVILHRQGRLKDILEADLEGKGAGEGEGPESPGEKAF